VHRLNDELLHLEQEIVRYALERVALQPPPLDGPRTKEFLDKLYGANITEAGIGGEEALRRFIEGYAPATLSTDHPRFLAFVPAAPTKASVLFDMIVSASSISGTSWLEAAGAVWCENEALSWLAGLAGFPEHAGGTFVSGGSVANLSGLHAARRKYKEIHNFKRPDRYRILASTEAHSSIASAADLMDAELIDVEVPYPGRLTGSELANKFESLKENERESVFAVVATAGTTNAGIIDDLQTIGDFCQQNGIWFHVDAAYGGAALNSRARERFAGIEMADSLVIDPHKWLFAPFDAAAILYRDPIYARRALTQEASYLDDINRDAEWNPSSYAYHLTRRVRGLPFWFSLATHGTAKYREAVEASMDLALWTAREIERREYLDLLLEPELSVVLFARKGWSDELYERWSKQALSDQVALVLPTTFQGSKALRMCFVNPTTTTQDVAAILDTLAWEPR
jgi:L-2,4-diaminobutyrate decarboxylase